MRRASCATAVYCPAVDYSADNDTQATFPSTLAGTSGVGTCANGLFGLPQLACDVNGVWANTSDVVNPCSGTPSRGLQLWLRGPDTDDKRILAFACTHVSDPGPP